MIRRKITAYYPSRLLHSLVFFVILLVISSCQRKKDEAKISGVWIAAPHHNTLMHSHRNIVDGLARLHKLGINTLFVCTWAEVKTAYKSQVLLDHTDYDHLDSTSFFRGYDYTSKTNDPLADLIAEAKKYEMKVILWFEFGFMANWGEVPNAGNNAILARHPDWLGVNSEGEAANYNDTDYYFNAYHPEVQQFLLDLISESLELYPGIAGIQGDDRLPASPANSGYDLYTLEKYGKEHLGSSPPKDFYEEDWVNWRLHLLNDFAVRLRQVVKTQNPDLVLAFSPNPYPWCKEKLMQDWPAWIDLGVVDLLSVQCYRRDFDSYQSTLDQALTYALPGLDNTAFVPGIILGTGEMRMVTPDVLERQLTYNRQMGIGGESFFYVKWLLESEEYAPVVKDHNYLRLN